MPLPSVVAAQEARAAADAAAQRKRDLSAQKLRATEEITEAQAAELEAIADDELVRLRQDMHAVQHAAFDKRREALGHLQAYTTAREELAPLDATLKTLRRQAFDNGIELEPVLNYERMVSKDIDGMKAFHARMQRATRGEW